MVSTLIARIDRRFTAPQPVCRLDLRSIQAGDNPRFWFPYKRFLPEHAGFCLSVAGVPDIDGDPGAVY
jgi:hypothetical protein